MKKSNDYDKDGINEIIHLSKNLLKIVYVIVIIGIVLSVFLFFKQFKILGFIKGVFKVISPLFIGFIIAWLFYPLHRYFTKKGLNKVLSAIIIFLMIVIFLFGIMYIFIPLLYNQVNELVSYIPTSINSFTKFLLNSINKLNIEGIDIESIKSGIVSSGEKYIVDLTSSLPNNIVNIAKSFVSGLGIILISLIVSIYMLIDFENLKVGTRSLLPKNRRKDYIKLFQNININSRRVVNGTLLVASLVFVLDSVGFAFIGLNAGVLFGLLCGITDLIPYIGPYIGGAAAVIVGFTQSPLIGLGTLIIAILVQLLESYVLQPMVMSKAMQLHPIIIIIGLLLFGYFFGIIGMIIATPCMAIIKEIILFIKGKDYKSETYLKD